MAITFEAKLPTKVPSSAPVFELPTAKAGAAGLRETARALGLRGTGGEVVTSPELVAYGEGRLRIEVVRASGALWFYDQDRYGQEPEQAFELSDRRAEGIARKFLQATQLIDPKAARLARVTHMRSAVGDVRGGRVEERVIDAGVVYRRTIGDIPVEGPGGFGLVTVAPEGDVVAFRSVWRPTGKRVANVRMRKPDEAMRALEEHLADVRGDVVVTKAAFGYFELAAHDRQRVIEPTYSFVYVVRAEEVAFKSAFVVHAGSKTFGPLLGKKRFREKQPERGE